MISKTERPWPHWMLRFIATDDGDAYEDAIWSVGGSPPWGSISYEEASAIYQLLEDYLGPGTVKSKYYNKARTLLRNAPERLIVLEIFQLTDQITSNPDTYSAEIVARGIALSKQVQHDGMLGTFLCYESGLAYRDGDLSKAIEANWQALQVFLRLADGDRAYARRAAQCSQNAISYLAFSGDREGALELQGKLAPILEGFDFGKE